MLFAFISHRSFPGVVRIKLLLAVVLILAGCGGGGSGNWQPVQGDGFAFDAPAAWGVAGAGASSGAVVRVPVLVFRLVRPYERQRRAATGRELDRVAAGVAAQLKGTISAKRSLEVDQLDARSYSIAFDGKIEEITFVLRGRSEYELLCRREAGGDDAPCARLLASFQVG